MSFQNLEQRMLHMYPDTFPDFVPAPDQAVSEASQRQFYDWMETLYRTLYDNPGMLTAKELHEDDAHTNRFNKAADRKPELNRTMRGIMKKMEDLLETLFTIGREGRAMGNRLAVDRSIQLSRRHLAILGELGISYRKEAEGHVFASADSGGLFQAWTWLAARPEASLFTFSRCMFDTSYSYPRDIYGRLSENKHAYYRLLGFLENNGYTRIDNRDYQLALDYVKNYGPKEMPVKDAWAERTHGGISAKYDPYVRDPAYYCLRVPQMKTVLGGFDGMSDGLKSFVVTYNKKCDGCRYCIQTDKTGTRKLQSITVEQEGKEYQLCLLFPGFYYWWTRLDDNLVSGMMEYLTYVDRLLREHG